MVEVVDTADNFMGGNDSFAGPLTVGLQADNANRATIIRFIELPFSKVWYGQDSFLVLHAHALCNAGVH